MKWGFGETAFLVLALAVGFVIGRASARPGVVAQAPTASFDSQARAYIDQKLGQQQGAAACGDLPGLIDRVSVLEKKMGMAQKLKDLRNELKGKIDKLTQAQAQLRSNKKQKLLRQRNIELKKMRQEIGQACAGVQSNDESN